VVAAGLLGAALAGCGARTVAFAPYEVAAGDKAACAALVKALPGHLLDQGRRVNAAGAGAAYSVAWGDPVIALSCGKPAAANAVLEPDTLSVDGVDWRYEKFAHAYRFHSVGLTPAIEVTVPDSYQPEATVLAELRPYLPHFVE
jgi:hypothetical protein